MCVLVSPPDPAALACLRQFGMPNGTWDDRSLPRGTLPTAWPRCLPASCVPLKELLLVARTAAPGQRSPDRGSSSLVVNHGLLALSRFASTLCQHLPNVLLDGDCANHVSYGAGRCDGFLACSLVPEVAAQFAMNGLRVAHSGRCGYTFASRRLARSSAHMPMRDELLHHQPRGWQPALVAHGASLPIPIGIGPPIWLVSLRTLLAAGSWQPFGFCFDLRATTHSVASTDTDR